MGIEKDVNEYGMEQRINSFDKVIKIGNKFLQVRLIETERFSGKGFTPPMPRARFIDIKEDPYYLVKRSDVLKMKGGKSNE